MSVKDAAMAYNATHFQTLGKDFLLPSVVFKFIAMIVGVLGNVTVIICVIFSNKKKTATSYLVANLALADLLVCLTLYPIWIVELVFTILDISSDQDLFCKLSRSTAWALVFASQATILAITVDRYFYILKPLKYPLIVTKKRVFKIIAVVWFGSCCLYIVMHVYWRKSGSKLRSYCIVVSDLFFVLLNIVVGCLPLFAFFVLNFQIFNVARKQRKRILAETTLTVGIPKEESSRTLIRLLHFLIALKAAKTFCILVVVLAVCVVIPSTIGLMIEIFCGDSCRQIWFIVCHYELYGINSIVNPFIYGMRHINYRKAFGNIPFKIFRCCRHCADSSQN